MFVLGEPHRLEISLGQETTKVIDKSIGRCLANVPVELITSRLRLMGSINKPTIPLKSHFKH